MSTDYFIFTNQKLDTEIVQSYVEKNMPLSVDDINGLRHGNFNILREQKGVAIHSFSCDGPFQVEYEDIPEVVASVLLAPRWSVQLSLPESSDKKDHRIALDFAKHVAEECQGTVYDPQTDVISWPKVKRKRFVTDSNEERIRLIEMKWYFPYDDKSGDIVQRFIEILKKICPEALPTRFGFFEPYQGKCEHGNYDSFCAMWEKVSDAQSIEDDFDWVATKPCWGGCVFFPYVKPTGKPESANDRVSLCMSFDGRALNQDERWREVIISLFTTISDKLGAFYAVGYVLRNAIVKRKLWFDSKSEESQLPRTQWWIGLPDTPMWLSWYGKSYQELVYDSIKNHPIKHFDNGILLQMSEEPMDRDQLKGKFPALPAKLTCDTSNINDPKPAIYIPDILPDNNSTSTV